MSEKKPETKEEILDKAISDLLGVEALLKRLPPHPKVETAELHRSLAYEALGCVETDYEEEQMPLLKYVNQSLRKQQQRQQQEGRDDRRR